MPPPEERHARALCRLLNKLTPTNFERVVSTYLQDQAVSSGAYNNSYGDNAQIRMVVETIVTRAASDARFVHLHAQLCQRLAVEWQTFRHVLWDYCWEAATTRLSSREAHDWTAEAAHHTAATRRARQMYLGKLRFVGALGRHNLLTVPGLLDIVETLLEQCRLLEDDGGDAWFDQNNDGNIPTVPLEGLCILLSECGQTLEGTVTSFESLQYRWHVLYGLVHDEDADESNNNNNHGNSHDDENDNHHPVITPRANHQHCPSHRGRELNFRMRHVVREVLELRAAAWQPTRYGARCRRDLVPQALDPHERVSSRRSRRNRNSNRRTVVRFVVNPSDAL